MSSQEQLIQQSIDAALANIKKFAPEQFEKLEADPSKKSEIIKAASGVAAEHLMLAEEFRTHASTEPHDIRERLAKHLPKERLQLIQTGLQVPTYSLNTTKKADEDLHHWVDFTRDGAEFMPSMMLNTAATFDIATCTQIISIIIEAIILVFQIAGITITFTGRVIKKIAEESAPIITGLIKKSIQALEKAVQSKSKWEIAKAMFEMIKDLYNNNFDFLWKIIKILCSEMTWWDWIATALKFACVVAAAIVSEGAALIVAIISALQSAVEFVKKFTNLGQLKDLKQNLS